MLHDTTCYMQLVTCCYTLHAGEPRQATCYNMLHAATCCYMQHATCCYMRLHATSRRARGMLHATTCYMLHAICCYMLDAGETGPWRRVRSNRIVITQQSPRNSRRNRKAIPPQSRGNPTPLTERVKRSALTALECPLNLTRSVPSRSAHKRIEPSAWPTASVSPSAASSRHVTYG